jgi:hypothetical protein
MCCSIACYSACTERKEKKEVGEVEQVNTKSYPLADHALLIFLDDSEGDENPVDKFGIMSSDLLSAIAQDAGPIIVSSSLIANISQKGIPSEGDPDNLLKRFNTITEKHDEQRTDQERLERKAIILSVSAFTPEVAQNWIIKEIDPFLYLLLPKSYLRKKKITDEQATAVSEKTITDTEVALGLKVNHMKTVTINSVKKHETSPEFADYFIHKLNAIFLINREYTAQNNKKMIPTWAIYINGHGLIRHSLAQLSIEQFKDFLTFLATKITTRLLVYSSCYAAGVNAQLIYKENQRNIDVTYPFAIISQALTDAPTAGLFLSMEVVQARLKVKPEIKYDTFLDLVTTSQTFDYRKFIEPLNNADFKTFGFSSFPQIRLAGLPWFSALDNEKVLAIGSILAKTRTTALDVGTFTKKGAKPLAILLYTQDVPFELIINTKAPETNAPPAIISMVTGNVVHHLKKISSKQNTIEAILNSFLTIEGLATHKVFVIDEITAPFTEAMKKAFGAQAGTISNVIIDLKKEDINIMYQYNGKVYKTTFKPGGYIGVIDNPVIAAEEKDKKKYADLLHAYSPQMPVTPESIKEIQDKVNVFFAKKVTYQEAQEFIIHVLHTMPDNVALHVRKITGVACPPDKELCWWNILLDLTKYASFDKHKVLWFDTLEICVEGKDYCYINMTDIIIDVYQQHVRVFYKDYDGKNPIMLDATTSTDLTEDYMPTYRAMFSSFAKSKTLQEEAEAKISAIERASVHQQLTPEVIKHLQKSLQKKTKIKAE